MTFCQLEVDDATDCVDLVFSEHISQSEKPVICNICGQLISSEDEFLLQMWETDSQGCTAVLKICAWCEDNVLDNMQLLLPDNAAVQQAMLQKLDAMQNEEIYAFFNKPEAFLAEFKERFPLVFDAAVKAVQEQSSYYL